MSAPDTSGVAGRIASHCDGFWLPRYTAGKLRTDPLYDGVFNELEGSTLPLLDIGCGLGILAMYLRERGLGNDVTGFDFDKGKIGAGRRMVAAGGYRGIQLSHGDARLGLPEHCGNVAILDILQFFDDAEKTSLLKSAATRVAPGGSLLIRSGLYGKSLRFYTTLAADMFAKLTFWMKAAPVHYPTAGFFRRVLEAEGMQVDIRPFWGRTPFNNYLIVAKRPE